MKAIDLKIDVVVPCFCVSRQINGVVAELVDKPFLRNIIVVDDACPEGSGKRIEEAFGRESRVKVLYHENNEGVGGAVRTGYDYAFGAGADVVVKLDGDGQMDPKYITSLVDPIVRKNCDYTKGNRFFFQEHLQGMPRLRFLGNSTLSLISKFASGYWRIMDPTNGFTALHRTAYRQLQPERLSRDYFFESDMLYRLGIANAVVMDVPMPAKYADERSSLEIRKVILQFPGRILRRFVRRLTIKYFISATLALQ